MKLTRERKIYAGLLAAAAAAMALDQVVFAPAEAGAASEAALIDAAPAGPVTVPVIDSRQFDFTAATLNADNSLAFRLQTIADQHRLKLSDLDNAFEPHKSWAPEPPPVVEKAAPLAGQEFQSRHKLTAVITNARGGIAMVDDKPLQVGQEIDGFRLMAVTSTTAVFAAGESVAVLELKLPPGAVPPAAAAGTGP